MIIKVSNFPNQPMKQIYRHYDSLLTHIQRAFHTNLKTQEVYLDLLGNTQGIRFAEIQNIYETLTEGKADEVIYQKEKSLLGKNSFFQQGFALRTCWRIVEKLVAKISYYLNNQKKLGYLGPSVLKSISLLKSVKTKSFNRQNFLNYFTSVVDLVLEENNFISEKIYELLIKRGYIYSVQEFYRMNRFEGPGMDYIYENEEYEGFVPPTQEHSEDSSRDFIRNKLLKKSKRHISSRQVLKTTSGSNDEEDSEDFLQSAAEKTSPCEEIAQRQSQDDLLGSQILNDINENIHEQLGAAVEELLQYEEISSSGNEDEKGSQEGVERSLKKLLKNVKNNYFKATEKYLVIDQVSNQKILPPKKTSFQHKQLLKPKRNNAKSMNKRTSIVSALNQRMHEKILKNEQMQAIQDLIVQNLGSFQEKRISSRMSLSNFRSSFSKGTLFAINMNSEEIGQAKKKQERRVSNIEFLNNAFVFKNKERRITMLNKNNEKPQPMTININAVKYGEKEKNTKTEKPSIFSKKNKMIAVRTEYSEQTKTPYLLSKFANGNRESMTKQTFRQSGSTEMIKRKKYHNLIQSKSGDLMSSTMLSIAAKKYHKFASHDSQHFGGMNYEDLYKLIVSSSMPSSNGSNEGQQYQTQQLLKKKKVVLSPQHDRRVEIYDRINRKLL